MERHVFTFFEDDDVKSVDFILPKEDEIVLLYDPNLVPSLINASVSGQEAVSRALQCGWTPGYRSDRTFYRVRDGEQCTPTHWALPPKVEPSQLLAEYTNMNQQAQPEQTVAS